MRAPGDIDNLIRRLAKWRDARQAIMNRPHRAGKALPNTELDDAILYLGEYKGVCEELR